MGKTSLFALATALTYTIVAPCTALAQAYKVEKYNIGGDGAFDYLTADPASGRVFVSRSTHVMIVDGGTGKVLGDLKDTPRVHGVAFVPKAGLGFTTNGGDSTSTPGKTASTVSCMTTPRTRSSRSTTASRLERRL